jgi:Ser-tRNA(Ala) deacylase AlaX
VTEEIAARDSYRTRAEGRVHAVVPEGVILDRSVFYARGGGQPGDTGVIDSPVGRLRVLDTFRQGGQIVHAVEDLMGLEPGMAVEGLIDWDRRYTLMRTHTALHALSGVVMEIFHMRVMQPAVEHCLSKGVYVKDRDTTALLREIDALSERAVTSASGDAAISRVLLLTVTGLVQSVRCRRLSLFEAEEDLKNACSLLVPRPRSMRHTA